MKTPYSLPTAALVALLAIGCGRSGTNASPPGGAQPPSNDLQTKEITKTSGSTLPQSLEGVSLLRFGSEEKPTQIQIHAELKVGGKTEQLLFMSRKLEPVQAGATGARVIPMQFCAQGTCPEENQETKDAPYAATLICADSDCTEIKASVQAQGGSFDQQSFAIENAIVLEIQNPILRANGLDKGTLKNIETTIRNLKSGSVGRVSITRVPGTPIEKIEAFLSSADREEFKLEGEYVNALGAIRDVRVEAGLVHPAAHFTTFASGAGSLSQSWRPASIAFETDAQAEKLTLTLKDSINRGEYASMGTGEIQIEFKSKRFSSPIFKLSNQAKDGAR